MKETLRLPEVAKEIGVHPSTLRRWCESGKGPKGIRTPGGQWIFTKNSVEAWLLRLEAPPELRPDED